MELNLTFSVQFKYRLSCRPTYEQQQVDEGRHIDVPSSYKPKTGKSCSARPFCPPIAPVGYPGVPRSSARIPRDVEGRGDHHHVAREQGEEDEIYHQTELVQEESELTPFVLVEVEYHRMSKKVLARWIHLCPSGFKRYEIAQFRFYNGVNWPVWRVGRGLREFFCRSCSLYMSLNLQEEFSKHFKPLSNVCFNNIFIFSFRILIDESMNTLCSLRHFFF